jgi:hypothetical protein
VKTQSLKGGHEIKRQGVGTLQAITLDLFSNPLLYIWRRLGGEIVRPEIAASKRCHFVINVIFLYENLQKGPLLERMNIIEANNQIKNGN